MEPTPELRAVVTGATGMVGRALVARLSGAHLALSLSSPDWSERVASTRFRDTCVFHLAARVHEDGGIEAFRLDNVEKTRALALAAAAGGAHRFVFLSTAKVNGDESPGRPFRTSDPADPCDAYAHSKWQAEEALHQVARERGLPVTIVRSPLVLGTGARANLRSLMRLADTPWPLPFGALENRRTMVATRDLVDLLCECAWSARAEGRLYFAGHDEAVSTRRLVAAIRRSLGRPDRQVDVPAKMLEAFASMAGKGDVMRRLTRSLELDLSATHLDIGWQARIGLDEAVAEMVGDYRSVGR